MGILQKKEKNYITLDSRKISVKSIYIKEHSWGQVSRGVCVYKEWRGF